MAEPKAFNKFVEITEIFWPRRIQDEPDRQQEHNAEAHPAASAGTAAMEAGGAGDG